MKPSRYWTRVWSRVGLLAYPFRAKLLPLKGGQEAAPTYAGSHPLQLQFPALAEGGMQQRRRFGAIGEPHRPGVPVQLAGHAISNRDHRQPLGVGTADREVAARGIAALAGTDPVRHVAGRPRKNLR